MKSLQILQSKKIELEQEKKELDLKIKYKKQYHSAHQLKIFRERRAYLNKEIKYLIIKLDLYG